MTRKRCWPPWSESSRLRSRAEAWPSWKEYKSKRYLDELRRERRREFRGSVSFSDTNFYCTVTTALQHDVDHPAGLAFTRLVRGHDAELHLQPARLATHQCLQLHRSGD